VHIGAWIRIAEQLKACEFWSVDFECFASDGMCLLRRGFGLLICGGNMRTGAWIWTALILMDFAHWVRNLTRGLLRDFA